MEYFMTPPFPPSLASLGAIYCIPPDRKWKRATMRRQADLYGCLMILGWRSLDGDQGSPKLMTIGNDTHMGTLWRKLWYAEVAFGAVFHQINDFWCMWRPPWRWWWSSRVWCCCPGRRTSKTAILLHLLVVLLRRRRRRPGTRCGRPIHSPSPQNLLHLRDLDAVPVEDGQEKFVSVVCSDSLVICLLFMVGGAGTECTNTNSRNSPRSRSIKWPCLMYRLTDFLGQYLAWGRCLDA